jgi:hypothetical protein
MFMRYFGGGIGHLNQGDRWTSTGSDEDDMDVDSDLEGEVGNDGQLEDTQDKEHQFQSLHNLAIQISSHAAGEEDEDVHSESDNDSEGSSNSSNHMLDLFNDTEDENEEEDFGPEDGEGRMEEDYGFGGF